MACLELFIANNDLGKTSRSNEKFNSDQSINRHICQYTFKR